MYEVRLESVVYGKFDYCEYFMDNEDKAIDIVKRHVPNGFSCHGLNDTCVQYAYGQVVDMADNRIVYRKGKSYP